MGIRARSRNRLVGPRRATTARSAGTASIGVWDDLTGGVSQRPPHLLEASQGRAQDNGWSSPVTGVGKRRQTDYQHRISTGQITDFYSAIMRVSDTEWYHIIIDNSGSVARLRIMRGDSGVSVEVHGAGLSSATVDGISVVTGTNVSYLWNSANLMQGFSLVNNGPLGLLLNRNAITAMNSALSPDPDPEAIVFVKAADFDTQYEVLLDGSVVGDYTTPTAAGGVIISTEDVAEELKQDIDGNANFTATRVGSTVYVKRTDNGDFDIETQDGRANVFMASFKRKATSVSDLPAKAKNGYLIEIESNPDTDVDNYWVKFVTESGDSYGPGVWEETVAPGIEYALDKTTMPLVIYRAAQDVFFVGPADGTSDSITVGPDTYNYTFPNWGDRTAGDETSVPTPSFVGEAIRDHNFFRSRYVVIGGDSMVTSEVDNVFNFFGDTATAVLETDPIDLRCTSEQTVNLEWVLPYEESVLLFSPNAQFVVTTIDADALTPRTAVVFKMSSIEMNVNLRPKIAGPTIVFSTLESGYTGFREYRYAPGRVAGRTGDNVGEGKNLTFNVPKYIEGTSKVWEVVENKDYFAAISGDNPNHVYVYKYLWGIVNGALAKQQDSWSRWVFGGDVRWLGTIDNDLYLVVTYSDGTYLEKLRPEEVEEQEAANIYLDRRLYFPECNSSGVTTQAVSASYDTATNRTTFTLPYTMQGETIAVVRFSNATEKGLQIGSASTGTDIVCDVDGDFTTADVAVGASYLFLYQFNKPYLPRVSNDRQANVGKLDGRLQIGRWTVNHFRTARYDVIVSRENRPEDSRSEYWARTLDVFNTTIDSADGDGLSTGSFRVPVMSKNTAFDIRVESTSWLPCTISGAEWEGQYSNRSRTVN